MAIKIQVIVALSLTLLGTFWITSCDDATVVSEIESNRQFQLENLYKNEVLPLHENFKNQTAQLELIAEEYATQPTLSTFESLRTQWIVTATLWKRSELFYFGPIRDKFLHSRVYKWSIEESKIDNIIAGTEVINADLVMHQGSNAVGLAAMEYLLFDPNRNKNDVHSELSADLRKRQYLAALSEQISSVSTEMLDDWHIYQNEFQLSLGSDLEGGQTILLNAMINHLELVVNTKIGKPLGKATGQINPNEAEAYRSQQSFEFIKANLITIKRVYTGDFTSVGHRIGFEDFLTNAGQLELRQKIGEQISKCQQDIDRFHAPLSTAVLNDRTDVEKLYLDMVDLLVLFKVDMGNVLGSTITFTDNDGD